MFVYRLLLFSNEFRMSTNSSRLQRLPSKQPSLANLNGHVSPALCPRSTATGAVEKKNREAAPKRVRKSRKKQENDSLGSRTFRTGKKMSRKGSKWKKIGRKTYMVAKYIRRVSRQKSSLRRGALRACRGRRRASYRRLRCRLRRVRSLLYQREMFEWYWAPQKYPWTRT